MKYIVLLLILGAGFLYYKAYSGYLAIKPFIYDLCIEKTSYMSTECECLSNNVLSELGSKNDVMIQILDNKSFSKSISSASLKSLKKCNFTKTNGGQDIYNAIIYGF